MCEVTHAFLSSWMMQEDVHASKRPPSEEQRVPLCFHALSDGPKGRSAGDSRHMPLDTGLQLVCIYTSHSQDPSGSSNRWVSWTFGSTRALCRADTEGTPAFLTTAALLGIHTRATGHRQRGLDAEQSGGKQPGACELG